MKRALLTLAVLGLTMFSVACGGVQRTATEQPGIDELRARATSRPDDPAAQTDLAIAEFLMDGGEASRVREQTERALALSPNDERLHLVAGLEAYLHGHPSAALDHILTTLDEASTSNRADASAVAEVAAAALEELANMTPEFRARTGEALTARLAAPGRIGPGATQTLTDSLVIAAYQRGDRDAVATAAAAQGCVPEWRVAGPFGPRELLGFDTRHAALAAGPMADEYDLGPFQGTRPTRVLESRGCGVHLGGGPTPSGGTTYAEAFVDVPADGEYVVRLETPNAVELYVDAAAAPAVRLDLRRTATARVTFHRLPLSAGRHELTVKITSRHPNPILMVSLTGDDGRAISAGGSAPEFTGALVEGHDPLSVYLRAAVSTARGDIIGAREALRQAGDASAAVLATRAAVALSDPLRPGDMRRDEARRLLRRMAALDEEAWFPALQLARLAAMDGRDVHAIGELRAHAERWPEMIAFPLSLTDLLLGRGWDAEADRYTRAARAAVPDACAPMRAELTSAQRRDRTAAVEAAIEALQACDARSNVRFTQALRTRRWDIAATELDRLAALEPSQSRAQILGSRLEVARGQADVEEVDRLLTSIAAERPRSSGIVLAQVDRLLAQSRRADALSALGAAIARDPESMADLRLSQRTLGGEDPMGDYRVDGAEVLAAFEASGREYDQPQVLVLDYTVMRVFEDHSALELTHNITRLQSEEAVDSQGEFQAPEGAYLLRLQTIKADGTRLEPDLIPGKETISMPSLAIGDYVEFEYVRVVDAPRGLPNAVLGTRFFFRSFEVPFDRSELTVVMPASMEPVIDPRGPAPETEERVEGDLRILHWGVTESRPLVQEPGSVSMREYVPSISWGVNARWQPFLDGLRDVLVDRDISDPAARRLAREVLAGVREASDLVKARRLYEWVLANVENNNDVFGLAPSMLAGRTGNRARVLHYLLGLSDIPSDLVLVRSYGGDQTRSELADDDTYGFLVVRVGAGSDASFLVTTARGTPFGYVPSALRGQDALVLGQGANRITLPAGDEGLDHHDIEALAVLASDGSARVTVVESFRGAGAIQWRGDLEGIAAALLEQRFEEGYVSRLMPGASLVSLRITGQDDADEPLSLRYTFDVPAFGRRQGGRFIVPGLFPSNLSPTFARLSRRTTPLLMTSATAVDVRIRVQAPEGTPAPDDLGVVQLEGPNGAEFAASSTTADGQTTIERRLRVPRMRVASDDYAAFARFCREADQSEAREISLTL